MLRDRRLWRQSERAEWAAQWLRRVEVVEEESVSVRPPLGVVVHTLPVARRLARRLLGDLAEVEVVGTALDLKFDEVNRLVRRDGVDADNSRTVRHAFPFTRRTKQEYTGELAPAS